MTIEMCKIDKWFLEQIKEIVETENQIKNQNNLENKVYLPSATINATKQTIAVIGQSKTLTNAYLSQYKCMKKAIINPAFKNIKNKINDHLSNPWN